MRGWLVTRNGESAESVLGDIEDSVVEAPDAVPPSGNRLGLRVTYSSLNYKDALALEGRPGVLHADQLVPGIDAVGIVDEPAGDFREGEHVVVTGAGLGETFHGGLAERVRVPLDAAIRVPKGWSDAEVAAVGTAGFTAALCVNTLKDHLGRVEDPAKAKGPVLVTGAGGGVGSISIMLLAALGYEVHAVTGRVDELGDSLRALGAVAVRERADFEVAGRPLGSETWAGAIDAAGGQVLATVLSQVRYGGIVAACGLAHSSQLPTTVLPFILRSVTLRGVDSVRAGAAGLRAAWGLLGEHLDRGRLASLTRSVPLADVRAVTSEILAGRGTGRTIVKVG